MSAYLKTLGLQVYFVTIKKFYLGNDKYLEANTQALHALRQTLSKQYLSIISYCDSAFIVWITSTSLKEQDQHILEENEEEMSPIKLASWSKGITHLR